MRLRCNNKKQHTEWLNMINTYGCYLTTPAHWPSATGKKEKWSAMLIISWFCAQKNSVQPYQILIKG